LFDGLQIVAAKVGDSLEVRRQFSQQPHQFQVHFRFPLQQPRRTHSMQIAVQVEPQQIPRVISWPARLRRRRASEPQLIQLETADEGIDEANGIIFGDIILHRCGKKDYLIACWAPNVIHQRPPLLIRFKLEAR
jgi:hypothetical protein